LIFFNEKMKNKEAIVKRESPAANATIIS